MPDPGPTFAQFVRCLRHAHPDLAYLHIVTPRVDEDGESTREPDEGERDDFIRAEWGERPIISSGGFGRESGMEAADKTGGPHRVWSGFHCECELSFSDSGLSAEMYVPV